jgi:protein-tyrosine phosphatase
MTDPSDQRLRPEFYSAQSGKLLAGNYPNAWDEDELRIKLQDLLKRGVTFFVDLTEEGEANSYKSLLKKEADILGRTVECQRMSIPDNEIPASVQMKVILDIIDSKLRSGHIVYVHCLLGVGRTGVVMGCYLARHGLGGAEALRELTRLQKGTQFEGMSSPASQKQREMVKSWPKGR